MNRKKYFISSIGAGLASYVVDFLTHVVVLGNEYKEHQSLFAGMDKMMKWIWLNPFAYFVPSFILGYVFIKGYEGRGVAEGVRFGILMGLLMEVPRFCFMTMYYDFPMVFDGVSLIAGLIKWVLVGILFAVLYKPVGKTN